MLWEMIDKALLDFFANKTVADGKRAFFMGNALVIGLIEKVGKVIASEIQG